jgi:hypothetical protein
MVSEFSFQAHNLRRYIEALCVRAERAAEVGLYNLEIMLTHSLKGAWFQPSNLYSGKLVSIRCFSNSACTATPRWGSAR